MTDGIRPIGPVEGNSRRNAERRASERRAGSTSRALVPVGPVEDEPPGPSTPAAPARTAATPDAGAAVFAAQMMGQTGQRKGLKGGPPVLDAARSTYLETEYSGTKERRPVSGKTGLTDV